MAVWWVSLTTDHWTSRGKDSYTVMTSHWINDKFELQNLVIGCLLHEVDSESHNFQDDFLEAMFNKFKYLRAKIVAVVSDTTSNMKKFGKLLEKLHIMHIYCTDHVFQITDKNDCLGSWYNGAVSVV